MSDDAKKVLAYLRGYVGHEGAQYGGTIRKACSMGKTRFNGVMVELVAAKQARSVSDPRGMMYSPMPW